MELARGFWVFFYGINTLATSLLIYNEKITPDIGIQLSHLIFSLFGFAIKINELYKNINISTKKYLVFICFYVNALIILFSNSQKNASLQFQVWHHIVIVSFSFYSLIYGTYFILHILLKNYKIEYGIYSEETCSICLVSICNSKTICNHYFCEDCINNWIYRNNNCPICRETLYKSLTIKNSFTTHARPTFFRPLLCILIPARQTLHSRF